MKDVAYWCKQKRHFMRVLRQARIFKNGKAIEANIKNVNKCDLKVGVIMAMQRTIGILIILCLLSSGCIEHTMRGAGSAINGVGQLIGGIGTDIVRATDGYSER